MAETLGGSSQQDVEYPIDLIVPQEPEENLRGSRSRLNKYFEVHVVRNTIYAYHSKGCQLIHFEGEEKPPRQAEILMALQTLQANMKGIRGLHNARKNSFILYPVDRDEKLLNLEKKLTS
ncbi:hypothetical protein ACJMK2_025042 [Sinanodonta woodiana]|uniref:Uncharacterized protein n=1 Tax=Sinanodonta woodiana TaxID=1069815 RepID=A0ABD3XHP4_SINWO